jgi:hypothetical protein
MERTPSGNAILSDTPYDQHLYGESIGSDESAAEEVKRHFRSRNTKSRRKTRHEQILRKLIKLDHPLDDGEIDDESLLGIVTTCDSIFFNHTLAGRVRWEWSSQEQYHSELIGTTALRKCVDKEGYETLIILSEPILRSPQYDRRLLLSAFLHELIHCYLFIRRGFAARIEGGHTKGWHTIAKIINEWVGGDYLSLCNFKANLNSFSKLRHDHAVDQRFIRYREDMDHYHHHSGCSHSPGPLEGMYREVTGASMATFEIPPWSAHAQPIPYKSQFI